MPPVWCTATFRGEGGEVRAEALLNSGADVIVLPASLARKIKPKPMGEVEVELADGRSLVRKVYEIEVEIVEGESLQVRKARALAAVERRAYPLIGTEAMEGLRIIPDVVRGKTLFV